MDQIQGMEIVIFFLALATCIVAAVPGGVFGPDPWYRALPKPSWTPPDVIFPVAWTLLYLSISAAAARLAGPLADGDARAVIALLLWTLQIVMNAVWTPLFFGARRPDLGLALVLPFAIAVTVTSGIFAWIDPVAGALMAPYTIWVWFAAALNAAIVHLLRGESS